MKHGTTQLEAHKRRSTLHWCARILIPTSVVLGVCIASCSGPLKSRPEQLSSTTPAQSPNLAGDGLDFSATSGSRAELQGTTSVGSWTSRSSEIHGQIILSASERSLESLFDRIQRASPANHVADDSPMLSLPVRSSPIADISIPVTSLHGDSSGMDHDMHTALKAAAYPSIKYVFQRVEHASVQWDPQDNQPSLKLHILGTLTMAGQSRPIAMDVMVKRDSPHHFMADAQTNMLMTDFGVTPPVALFGLIKAADEVHVVFDLDLALSDHSPGIQSFAKTSDPAR